MKLARTISRIAEELDRKYGLAALYLHGSRAAERARPDSDLDLAVLLSRPPPRLELATTAAELSAAAGLEVDLVDLGDASPILSMQVLRNGRLIGPHDAGTVARFFMRTVTDYADLRRVRAPVEAALRERMSHG